MQSTIHNRTIFCRDNLEILAGIDNESIDLIYLDPPFNKKKVFSAPIGSSAEGAIFSDIFREEDVKEEWVLTIKEDNEKLHNFLLGIRQIDGRQSYNFCYLCYMSIRMIACHRVLKDTGSIYLHCDPTMSHYLKIVMDCVFGEQNFKNEISWCYTGPSGARKNFPKKKDIIFWYSKSEQWVFNRDKIRINYKSLHSDKGKKSKLWGRIGQLQNETERKKYLTRGKVPEDYWIDIPSGGHISPKERTGYPTQKPLALLERIIKASSNEGDVVLDPFCGCATTCVAAEKLGRKWIGIDISQKAYDLVRKRLGKEVYEKLDFHNKDNFINFSVDAPKRTNLDSDYTEKKYVYVISNKAYPEEYKVGIARNWKNRLNSYQTSDPDRGYEMEYKKLTPHFRELEKHIHNTFENRHEWVTGDLQDIIKEIEDFL